MRSNPLSYLFAKTWRYSEGNRHAIVRFTAMFIIAEIIWVFVKPLVWAKMMNMVQKEGVTEGNIRTLFSLLGLNLLGILVFWALHGPARYIEEKNAFRARINYRRFLLKGVMTLPMGWHGEHHSGNTIDKIEKGATGLFNFSESSFEIIYSIVKLTSSYAVLVYFSPPAAYIVLAMMAVSAAITMSFDRVLIGRYKALNQYENRISESVFDAISNISTVIILRVERLVFGAIMRKVEEPFDLKCRTNALSECKWFLTNLCCTLMTTLVLGVYFWQNVGTAQGVLVGSIYLLIKYLEEVSELFSRFNSMYGDIIIRKTRVENAQELAADFRPENFENHVLHPGWQQLDITDLSFSYHENGAGSAHLEDVSLSLRRGDRIALVGSSGSGKTTLLKVMRNLYHPKSLRLSVDGTPLPLGFEGICRAIALVPQDPELFATTILENLTLGADYDLDFVRRFTDMACMTHVIDALPHGLHSSIREKGVNFSGGQRQRLALARGLLACHDKEIVLLDEPTSSLDAKTEMEVYRNVFATFTDKTVVSSVHRLHLLPLFHRIYVFAEGRIIAAGSLADLLISCPLFQRLWQQYHEQEAENTA
jgi:ATP-binding cassette, subfamily B, bacterial